MLFRYKKILYKTSSNNSIVPTSTGPVRTYIFTFFLTLTNPTTILDFMALFTGLHINITNHHDALIFVLGVFLGSTIWWFLLCFTVALFRKKISLEIVQCINYAAGIVIFSFGLYTFSTFISHNFFWTLCKTTRLAMWLII